MISSSTFMACLEMFLPFSMGERPTFFGEDWYDTKYVILCSVNLLAERSHPSSSKEQKINPISSWPSKGITWWQVALMTLLLVLVTLLLMKCMIVIYQHGWMFSKISCYLCLEKVNKRAWMSGKHRQECIKRSHSLPLFYTHYPQTNLVFHFLGFMHLIGFIIQFWFLLNTKLGLHTTNHNRLVSHTQT